MKIIPIAVLLGCAVSGLAQTARPAADGWEKICKDSTAQLLVEPRLSGPLSAANLGKCDAEALYYGFGSKPDYAAALQCAWQERAHQDSGSANMNYGVGVLTMLYANGRGVEKNINQAIRFACEQPWAAPAEMAGRVEHLVKLKDSNSPSTPFDMCDDITSGLGMGKCAQVTQRFADFERDRKLAAITGNFTTGKRRLYDNLHAAEEAFNDVRIDNEVDLSGSARAMFALGDLAKLRDQFLINLQRFEKGDVPQATADDVKALDAQMNDVYQRIMQTPDDLIELGTVKKEGIRKTQRAWLKLRDVWMEYAKNAYPKLSSERVMAQLIRLRLNQLQLLPIQMK